MTNARTNANAGTAAIAALAILVAYVVTFSVRTHAGASHMSDTTTSTVATNANAKRTRKGQPTAAQQIEALRKDLARATERGEASTSKGKRIRRALRALGWFGGSRTRTSTDPRVTGKGKGKAKRVMKERTAKATSVRPDASERKAKAKATSANERAANRALNAANAAIADGPNAEAQHDANGTA